MDPTVKKVVLFATSCLILTLARVGGISSARNYEFPSDWCPPVEFNCGCTFNEQEIGTDEQASGGYAIPVKIICESSDIMSILYFIPKPIRSVKIGVAPDSTDQILQSMTFFNFSQLEMLDLSDNAFRGIQMAAFHDAEMLSELKLSNNLLVELQEGTFSGILEGDPFDSMYPVAYRLPNLKKLQLDNNDISFVADGVFANMSNLLVLDLTSNNLADINAFTFYGLSGLNYLSLADNVLRRSNASFWHFLRNIREIDMSDNDINFVESESFAELMYLYTLRLDNNQIEEIQSPGLVIPSVSSLNLSYNSISHVSYDIFENNQNLTWLNLDGNGINEIDIDAWGRNDLEELFLNNNNLGDIRTAFLFGLTQLRHLEMMNNHINFVVNYMFGFLQNIRVLNLNHNRLTFFPSDVFKPEFDPRKRELPIPPKLIEKLYVNDNRLMHPLVTVLVEMTKTEVYAMNNNKLHEIRALEFPYLSKLTDIDLSANQIFRVEENAFANLPALQHLNLKDNTINILSVRAFVVVPSTLFLDNNPMHCDCSITWIRESIPKYGNVFCETPQDLKNMTLSSLQVSDFHCPIEYNESSPAEFTGYKRSDVRLDCPIMADEQITVEWFMVPSVDNERSGQEVIEELGGTNDSNAITYPNGSLHINNIVHEKDVNYSCRATNHVDQKTFSVLLRVRADTLETNPSPDDGTTSSRDSSKTDVMKYALGGAAGAMFVVGLIGVLLAFLLPTKRNHSEEKKQIGNELPIVETELKNMN